LQLEVRQQTNEQFLEEGFMKKALLVALCAMGLSSVASADYQVVYHDYSLLLGVGPEGIALNNACVTDTEVKSIAPVKVCAELAPVEVSDPAADGGQTRTEWVCKSYELQTLSAPRAFKREVCVNYQPPTEASEGGCLEFGAQDDFLPNTIKTSIVTVTGGDAGDDFPGVQSTHTFPACK
jgi:hypothetical protein